MSRLLRATVAALGVAAEAYDVEVVGKVGKRCEKGAWMHKIAAAQLKGAEAMARCKAYDLNQAKMIPLSYADQIVEGSFEHALNEVVEEHLDLTVFEKRYANDETGLPGVRPRRSLPSF
jgi:hypothetical protein